jgi:hypothetical protein
MECDTRFGDEWPGRIPAQLVAHILYFFSEPGDLVLDPEQKWDTLPFFNTREKPVLII